MARCRVLPASDAADQEASSWSFSLSRRQGIASWPKLVQTCTSQPGDHHIAQLELVCRQYSCTHVTHSRSIVVGRLIEVVSDHSFMPLRPQLYTLLGVDPIQIKLGGFHPLFLTRSGLFSPCDHQLRAVLVVHWEECLECLPLGWVPCRGDASSPEDQVMATW